MEKIRQFEMIHSIDLPGDYIAFLICIANGEAKPLRNVENNSIAIIINAIQVPFA